MDFLQEPKGRSHPGTDTNTDNTCLESPIELLEMWDGAALQGGAQSGVYHRRGVVSNEEYKISPPPQEPNERSI